MNAPLWHWLWPVYLAIALGTSIHIVINKREPGSSVSWITLVWLSPLFGVIFYWLFGINRIDRKAFRMRGLKYSNKNKTAVEAIAPKVNERSLIRVGERLGLGQAHSLDESQLFNLTDNAFNAMIETIEGAKSSVTMLFYTLRSDALGFRFAEALLRAKTRGVDIRVLVDGVGSASTLRSVMRFFRKHGIKAEEFLPPLAPLRLGFLNLRNHRKLLIIDGDRGFVGGANIGLEYLSYRDHVTYVRGRVVTDLQQVFADDWEFTTGERLGGAPWFVHAPPKPVSDFSAEGSWARVLASGPGPYSDRLRWFVLAAVSASRESMVIRTPYFLPDTSIMSALCAARLRGVDIRVLVPAESDFTFLSWAQKPLLTPLLEFGVEVRESPAPFDHSKIFIVDGKWVSIGSGNWDQRSLRLNFELNLEIGSETIARTLRTDFDDLWNISRPLTLETLKQRNALVKLRDAVARLFTPFL